MKKIIVFGITIWAALSLAVGVENVLYCFNNNLFTVWTVSGSIFTICVGLGLFFRNALIRKVVLVALLLGAAASFFQLYNFLNSNFKSLTSVLLSIPFFLLSWYFFSHPKVKECFKGN